MDFSTVTETAKNQVTAEALSMMYTRYEFARQYIQGKKVLEVACGIGQGLGYISDGARWVMGGDFMFSLLSQARKHYKERMPLIQLDAHGLPFQNKSFDVIVFYEAIYYLDNPKQFLRECQRVLADTGVVLICSANRERQDFNPSPYSKKYYSAFELSSLLHDCGFNSEMYGAYSVEGNNWKNAAVSTIKQAAVAMNLVPKTMKSKEFLKRLFLGKLKVVPPELKRGTEGISVPIKLGNLVKAHSNKVIYAVGRRSCHENK